MNLGKKLTNCRMCGSNNLYEFLDLGFSPPSDGILNEEEIKLPEIFFPLKVTQCEDCGLTQLTYVVNPEFLYGEKYSYESSITETGKKHYFEMAESICKKFSLKTNDLVVDIGSNVGILLEGFKKNGLIVLGIEAAPKIVAIANKRGIETWKAFMDPSTAKKIVDEKGKAKIIVSTNVFAHIDDKNALMESIKIILDDEGIFIIEVPYLVDLIENLEYDTIYLEHLEYLSLKPLINFFTIHNMEIFDIERYEIHGKSIRVFIGKKGMREVSKKVDQLLGLEIERGIYTKDVLDNFAKKVQEHKKEFLSLLRDLKKQSKKIVGISAPAKGNTILNFCKINNDLIDYMTEKSKIKLGHYTPGMHIPIVDEKKLLEDNVDYGIIFAWNFADEIIKNNLAFSKKGGKFIKPIPKPVIIEENQNLLGVEIKKIGPNFTDERGIISDLLNKSIGHVGLITTEKNAVRANHYHKLSTQYNYILSGKFEVLVAPVNKPDNIKKFIVDAGELIIIPPNIIHQFKALDRAVMIDMVSESRDGGKYEDDVYRVKIENDE